MTDTMTDTGGPLPKELIAEAGRRTSLLDTMLERGGNAHLAESYIRRPLNDEEEAELAEIKARFPITGGLEDVRIRSFETGERRAGCDDVPQYWRNYRPHNILSGPNRGKYQIDRLKPDSLGDSKFASDDSWETIAICSDGRIADKLANALHREEAATHARLMKAHYARARAEREQAERVDESADAHALLESTAPSGDPVTDQLVDILLNGVTNLVPGGVERGLANAKALIGKFAEKGIDRILGDGFGILHHAVSGGSPILVKAVLGAGADPNLKGHNDITPIHLAADPTHSKMKTAPGVIALLAQAGADPSAPDVYGVTPLDKADRAIIASGSDSGAGEIRQALADLGAKRGMGFGQGDKTVDPLTGKTSGQFHDEWIEAKRRAPAMESRDIMEIMNKTAITESQQELMDSSPEHIGDTLTTLTNFPEREMMREILKYPDGVNESDPRFPKAMNLLIGILRTVTGGSDAFANAMQIIDDAEKFAEVTAEEAGMKPGKYDKWTKKEMENFERDRAGVNESAGPARKEPAAETYYMTDPDKGIRESVAVPADASTPSGGSVLHIALECNDERAAALIAESRPDLVNAPDAAGRTPMHEAVGKAPGAIPALMDAGADLGRRDADGNSPVDTAILGGLKESLEAILGHPKAEQLTASREGLLRSQRLIEQMRNSGAISQTASFGDRIGTLLSRAAPAATAPKRDMLESLSGETVVFTGELQSMRRAKASKLAKESGAFVGSSITNKTTLLVVGLRPGRKVAQAEAKGVEIISEDAWLKRIGKTKADFAESSEPLLPRFEMHGSSGIANMRDRLAEMED